MGGLESFPDNGALPEALESWVTAIALQCRNTPATNFTLRASTSLPVVSCPAFASNEDEASGAGAGACRMTAASKSTELTVRDVRSTTTAPSWPPVGPATNGSIRHPRSSSWRTDDLFGGVGVPHQRSLAPCDRSCPPDLRDKSEWLASRLAVARDLVTAGAIHQVDAFVEPFLGCQALPGYRDPKRDGRQRRWRHRGHGGSSPDRHRLSSGVSSHTWERTP